MLLVAGEDGLDCGAWDGLRAAARRHLGFVGCGLVYHNRDAGLAVSVPAGEGLEGVVGFGEVVAAADAGTV